MLKFISKTNFISIFARLIAGEEYFENFIIFTKI